VSARGHVRANAGNRPVRCRLLRSAHCETVADATARFFAAVADFSTHGFELLGGRQDYVGGQSVAVLVYPAPPARDRRITGRPGKKPQQTLTRDGFNIESSRAAAWAFARVDLNRHELDDFARSSPQLPETSVFGIRRAAPEVGLPA